MTELKLGELFCGPGGLSLGAMIASQRTGKKTGFRIKPVWAVDRDLSACKTYRRNIHPKYEVDAAFDSGPVLNTDVNAPGLLQKLARTSAIDILSFGFPCNDYSIVGEKKGLNGSFGPLYKAGVKALNHFNPRVFIAENVSGLRSANSGRAWREIMHDLQNAGKHGYELTPHKYEFEYYGVPQRRHRWVIVGVRKGAPGNAPWRFLPPAPDSRVTNVSDCFKKPIPDGMNAHTRIKQHPRVVERLQYILPGQNAWNADIPSRLRLNVKGATLSQIYRRLKYEEPAYTVTGSGGGGTHVYHWKDDRALTNRERARLQSFPDTFEFEGTSEEIRRQVGMAVPPEGAARIFEAILLRMKTPNELKGLVPLAEFDAEKL